MTLACLLKDNGYNTGMVGKLGHPGRFSKEPNHLLLLRTSKIEDLYQRLSSPYEFTNCRYSVFEAIRSGVLNVIVIYTIFSSHNSVTFC